MKEIKIFEMEINDLVVPCTLALGALVILVILIISRRKTTALKNNTSKVDDPTNKFPPNCLTRSATGAGAQSGLGFRGSGSAGGKKSKNKKRREATQDFTHSWMIGALKGHTAPVLDLSFSSNGKFLASCAEDRTVHIWCTKDLSSKERKSLRVNIDYDYATHVQVSPDGKAFIIHKSLGNNIEVYGLKRKNSGFFTLATPVLEFPKKHEEDIIGMEIACNGKYIMTCSKTNELIIWGLKGEVLGTVDTYLGSTHKAKISPCGRYVGASGFTPDVKVWKVGFAKTGEFKQIGKAFNLAGHSSGVYDFDFSADSSYMASVSKDGTYRFYETKVEFEKGEDPRLLVSGRYENSAPSRLVLSPGGEILAISHGTALSFYSTITGKLDITIKDIGFVACMAFDASGEFLLVAVDKHIRIFRNIAGYQAAILSATLKLKQKQTSATKERLEKLIIDKTKFLKLMGGEYLPE